MKKLNQQRRSEVSQCLETLLARGVSDPRSVLARLAIEVREYFILRQREFRFKGERPYELGASDRDNYSFIKLACIAVKEGVSPRRCVDIAFTVHSPRPYLNQLASACVAEAVHLYKDTVEDELRLSLTLQLDRWNTEINCLDRDPREVLLDRKLSLGPVLRYCLAEQHGYGDIARAFEWEATVELACESAYHKVYGSFIPGRVRCSRESS